MTDPRSRIPGLDRLLLDDGARPILSQFPRSRVADALREAVAGARDALARDAWPHDPADPAPYLKTAARRLEAEARPSLRGVINATGVVLHTNLGRAPLAPEARQAMVEAATGYSNLEFDLAEGRRGSRYEHCRSLLCELTGAADAVVVNNCAAALVVAMNALAEGRGVVVSRGELVEIGGGFRIPEMLARAGARLVEVGSTNRTRRADYEAAFAAGADLGAILKVHRSNFRIRGFTESTDLDPLVAIAAERDVPLVHDIGSGLLIDHRVLGLPLEPTVIDSVSRGVGLAVFSGDKLLGGPQAGIVVGRPDLVERVRRNPLCRAMRVDKATLAALEATLRLYRDPGTVLERVPVLRMLSLPIEELHGRAETLAAELGGIAGVGSVTVETSVGRVGGGTFPDHELPARVVRVSQPVGGVQELARRLRVGPRPVVGRLVDGSLLFDPRTVAVDEEGELVDAVREAVRPTGSA